MIDKHRVENEEWINARKDELREERRQLELEKVSLSVQTVVCQYTVFKSS